MDVVNDELVVEEIIAVEDLVVDWVMELVDVIILLLDEEGNAELLIDVI